MRHRAQHPVPRTTCPTSTRPSTASRWTSTSSARPPTGAPSCRTSPPTAAAAAGSVAVAVARTRAPTSCSTSSRCSSPTASSRSPRPATATAGSLSGLVHHRQHQFPTVGDTLTADASTVVDPVGIDLATEVFSWQALTGIDPFDFHADLGVRRATARQYVVQPTDVGPRSAGRLQYSDINGNVPVVDQRPHRSGGGRRQCPAEPRSSASSCRPPITDPTHPRLGPVLTPGVGVAASGAPIAGALIEFDVNGVTADRLHRRQRRRH